jgi:hypothetical protein
MLVTDYGYNWIFDISTKAIIHNRLRTVSPFGARCRFIGMLDGPDALALPWQKIVLFFFAGANFSKFALLKQQFLTGPLTGPHPRKAAMYA